MRILGINHLGIAAKDPEQAKHFFSKILDLQHLGDEIVEEQKTSTSMIRSSQLNQPESPKETRLEIVEATHEDSPIAKYLSKKGGGIHHLALTVDDLNAAIEHMKSNQIEMIDEVPRDGVHQTKIAFIHPRSTGGILVELVQERH